MDEAYDGDDESDELESDNNDSSSSMKEFLETDDCKHAKLSYLTENCLTSPVQCLMVRHNSPSGQIFTTDKEPKKITVHPIRRVGLHRLDHQ